MSKLEKSIFWGGMWFSPIYYLAVVIAYLLTFKWVSVPLNILGMLTSGSNLMAYLKCSKDARMRMKMVQTQVKAKATDAAMGYA